MGRQKVFWPRLCVALLLLIWCDDDELCCKPFFLLLSHEKWKRKAFATKTTPHSPPGLRSPIPWWHYAVFVAPCLVQTLCYSGKRVKNGELSIANAIMILELKNWSFQENLIYSYMMLIANPFQNLNSNYLSILLCSYITIDPIISVVKLYLLHSTTIS